MTIDTQKLRQTARLLSSHHWNCLTPYGVDEVLAAADELDSQAAEIEALKHDIAEYVRIASDQGTEIERLREVLKLAYGAMNYLGDVLNGMDAVEPEDEAATTPAFDAVRAALSGESK